MTFLDSRMTTTLMDKNQCQQQSLNQFQSLQVLVV